MIGGIEMLCGWTWNNTKYIVAVDEIKNQFGRSKCRVKVVGTERKRFQVRVSLRQGYFMSPRLFIGHGCTGEGDERKNNGKENGSENEWGELDVDEQRSKESKSGCM